MSLLYLLCLFKFSMFLIILKILKFDLKLTEKVYNTHTRLLQIAK